MRPAIRLAALAALAAIPAAAQDAGGCARAARADPPSTVLTCPDGLVITAERAAALRPIDADRDGRPEAAELSGGAALVTLPDGRRGRGDFQIRTPHALATVRGTVYAVDVAASGSAVFVVRGRVAVARAAGSGRGVTLRAGEGVDVAPGSGPLVVKRWARPRATALLARLGR